MTWPSGHTEARRWAKKCFDDYMTKSNQHKCLTDKLDDELRISIEIHSYELCYSGYRGTLRVKQRALELEMEAALVEMHR
ncbi:hypothetical protein MMC21_005480 [Puttea exsequens]|nr:hypothetical protein [Puttea exsequens]